jgi:hypothetical protein
MSQEEVWQEIVDAAKRGDVPKLSDAVKSLIDSAVRHEREECARLAEDWGDAGGMLTPGQRLDDPARRPTCLDIARRVRDRK